MMGNRFFLGQWLTGLSFLILLLLKPNVGFGLPKIETRDLSPSSQEAMDQALEMNPQFQLFQQVQQLQDEVQHLRGRLETQEYRLQQLSQALNHPQRPSHSSIEPSFEDKVDESALVSETPAEIKSVGQLPKEEKAAYEWVYRHVKENQFDLALEGFKAFLSAFPEGELTANAWYWLGELYTSKGELDAGTHAFNTVIARFPQSPKAPDALLKLGFTEYRQGKWTQAHQLLNHVVELYPNTASARLAQTKIKQMKTQGKL